MAETNTESPDCYRCGSTLDVRYVVEHSETRVGVFGGSFGKYRVCGECLQQWKAVITTWRERFHVKDGEQSDG